ATINFAGARGQQSFRAPPEAAQPRGPRSNTGRQIREELEARHAAEEGRSVGGGAGGGQAGSAAAGLPSDASPEELSDLVLTIQDGYAKLSKDKASPDEAIDRLESELEGSGRTRRPPSCPIY
ncbi:hypothetical protein THAOC_34801, partial [Thalassiosira oceanica]